jgi:glutamate dehydrogenase (NADP+)
MYKKMRNEFTGVLTGKGLRSAVADAPGSHRYGVAYFAQEMLKTKAKPSKARP